MEEFKVDDLVTVKPTSPKYRYYKDKIGTVCDIPARFDASINNVVVDFDGLKCSFYADAELEKI